MQQKLLELEVSGKKSSDCLLSMEHQFSQIEVLDKKVAAAEQMNESH
jgi:hypothetical protein